MGMRMSDEKIKIDPIDYYFGDLNKYPTMSQDELNKKLTLVYICTGNFETLLAGEPEAQKIYVEEWREVMRSGKRVHKMSGLTGKTQRENAHISNDINTAMKLAEASVDRIT